MNNRVIIVYNGVPELIEVYDLKVSDSDLERIKGCSGSYVNMSGLTDKQEEDTNWLSLFLEGKTPSYSERQGSEKVEPFSCSEPCTIVVTGFLF